MSNKIKEREQIFGFAKTPLTEFLNEIDKFKEFPKNFGMMDYKGGTGEEINVKSFYIGDRYASAFSKGIKDNPAIKSLNLSRNNLKDEGFEKIIESVPDGIESIDLSNNDKISLKSYQSLVFMLDDPHKICLVSLSLESNNLNDSHIDILNENLCYNRHLKFLNLSKNNLTNRSAERLADMLIMNDAMNILFIHWNKIQSKGAITLFKSLQKNTTLQVLDISFNSIGSDKDCLAAKEFSVFCEENKSVVHIDISHCNFNTSDMEVIGHGLKKNHTLLGIHLIGNKGIINSKGFVSKEEDPDPAMSQVFSRIHPDLRTGKAKNNRQMKLQAFSNCWICEGWSEIRFEWRVDESKLNPEKRTKVKIHLSCDNYEPDKMRRDPTDKSLFFVVRMVPPGDLKFYFTVNGEKFISNEMKIKDTEKLDNLNVPKTNVIENIIQKDQLITQTYLTNLKAIPRPRRRMQRPRPKTPWDVSRSVFKTYIDDTPQLLAQCFEFDWNCSKITKFIKDYDIWKDIKKYLKANYRAIREAYKQYSAVAPSGVVPSIGVNVFGDMVSNFEGLVDYKLLKLSDIDLDFVSTKAPSKPRYEFLPERQLGRFQFLEILVRIGITKYFKTGICKTLYESIHKCFEEHFKPFLEKFDSKTWRNKELWTEECDTVFKRYHSTLTKVYSKFSGKYALPGAPHFMSIDEFFEIICATQVVNDEFGQREIGSLYNLAMMTRVDELNEDRHMNMTFVEFLEGIGRVAHRLKLPQLINDETLKVRNYDSFLKSKSLIKSLDSEISIESIRQNTPLHLKIETLIYMMSQSSLPKEYNTNLQKQVEKYYKSLPKEIKLNSEDYTSSEDDFENN